MRHKQNECKVFTTKITNLLKSRKVDISEIKLFHMTALEIVAGGCTSLFYAISKTHPLRNGC